MKIGRFAPTKKEEKQMGKFSTGLLTGAMLGIGVMMMDKRTAKKAKKALRKMAYWG